MRCGVVSEQTTAVYHVWHSILSVVVSLLSVAACGVVAQGPSPALIIVSTHSSTALIPNLPPLTHHPRNHDQRLTLQCHSLCFHSLTTFLLKYLIAQFIYCNSENSLIFSDKYIFLLLRRVEVESKVKLAHIIQVKVYIVILLKPAKTIISTAFTKSGNLPTWPNMICLYEDK